MPNLNYASDYQEAIYASYGNYLYFSELYNTPNNATYGNRWDGHKTIYLPKVTVKGRRTTDRDNDIVKTRRFDNDWEPYTLAFDRFWDTYVDPMDIDETNYAASIANLTQEYRISQMYPEMDAYMVSKVYSDWTNLSGAPIVPTSALSKDNIVGYFDKMVENFNKNSVTGQRIVYVTSDITTMLKNAPQFNRNINVENNASGIINREVINLDGIRVVSVPDNLMKTVYTFDEGFAIGAGAKQIKMFMITPTAIISPVKYTSVSLADPSALTQDKYYYYERSYGDVFVMERRYQGIEMLMDFEG